MTQFGPYTPLSERNMIDVRPIDSAPASAPRFTIHRTLTVIDGAGAITNGKRGMNMAGFEKAHIKVLPGATAAPDLEVLFWSETKGEFLSDHTPLAYAKKAVGVAWEITVEVQGRIIFVKVPNGTFPGGATCEIQIAGAELDHAR